MHEHAARNTEYGDHDSGRQTFGCGAQETLEDMLINDDPPKACADFRGGRDDEAADHINADQELHQQQESDERADADCGGSKIT